MTPQDATQTAAHITANATFTIGLIAALSAMMFSWVLPKMFEYNNNRNTNTLKELIEMRKSIPDYHKDAVKFDEIIEYRRKRYLGQQVLLLRELKDADDMEALEGWKRKERSWLHTKLGISGWMLSLGILTVFAIVGIGILIGKFIMPI